MTVRIGSLFSGIGGFELGLERAIPGAETVWQCEQNTFCQKVLKKHWPSAVIYDDVRTIDETVAPIDILCGGFPCQDISVAGKQRGIEHGTRSGLWWEMHRIARVLQPRIIIMENVSAILSVGGRTVIGSLAEIGYDCEWTVIPSGSMFGLPHERKRWFGVAYPSSNASSTSLSLQCIVEESRSPQNGKCTSSNLMQEIEHIKGRSPGKETDIEPFLCGMDDGVPIQLDRNLNNRLKALGNAITPPASEWVGLQILKSGLLDDLIGGEE